MELATRRRVGRLIQVAFVVLGLLVVGRWASRKINVAPNVRMTTGQATTTPATLGPGDVRIYNDDSTVTVTLAGDELRTGLSEKVIQRMQEGLARETSKESGLGATIASTVQKTVGSAMTMQMAYPLRDVKELSQRDGHIVIVTDRATTELFRSINVDGKRGAVFSEADFAALQDAVRRRRAERGF